VSELARAAFLAGRWRGLRGDDVCEELWLPPECGSMGGVFRWIGENGVRFWELTTIAEDAEHGLVFRMRHFDPDLTPWEERDAPFSIPFASAGDGAIAFEGPNPKGENVRFEWASDGAGVLVGSVERAGERHEFRYERVAS
jgi:hypothetical protein